MADNERERMRKEEEGDTEDEQPLPREQRRYSEERTQQERQGQRTMNLALFAVRQSPKITWLPLASLSSFTRNQQTVRPECLEILGNTYEKDHMTNVTPAILSKLNRNLHNRKHHPLNIVRRIVQEYFYLNYCSRVSSPIFSIYDNISPVVTLKQNFDSILVPESHVSRAVSDSYYINSEYMLRAHTSAHQVDLIKSGLDAFLVFGDVYRRDAIDRTHYPVFHQVEGLRIYTSLDLLGSKADLRLLEKGERTSDKQSLHTIDAVKIVEHELKTSLEGLAACLFGHNCEMRWVESSFPFTHPSWELEVQHNGAWLETLGCGVIEQDVLINAGAGDRVGWAFGLGLDRIAMKMFDIPDIRILWSEDSGFLSQFVTDNIYAPIIYKAVSVYPQCINDISFWITDAFAQNDFFDVVRSCGGDLIEQVDLKDEFHHPGTRRRSQCYRIVYRHTEKTLGQDEVNAVHREIERCAVERLGVEIR